MAERDGCSEVTLWPEVLPSPCSCLHRSRSLTFALKDLLRFCILILPKHICKWTTIKRKRREYFLIDNTTSRVPGHRYFQDLTCLTRNTVVAAFLKENAQRKNHLSIVQSDIRALQEVPAIPLHPPLPPFHFPPSHRHHPSIAFLRFQLNVTHPLCVPQSTRQRERLMLGMRSTNSTPGLPQSSKLVTPGQSQNYPLRTEDNSMATKASVGMGLLFYLFVVMGCGAMCYRDYMRRKELNVLEMDAIRRQRIRSAVRAKIAEMEGLPDEHSFHWYIEQRDPEVHFGDVIEISPECTSQSVSVLYSTGEEDDLVNYKRLEISIHDLLGNTRSGPGHRYTTSPCSSQSPKTSPNQSSAFFNELTNESELDVKLPARVLKR